MSLRAILTAVAEGVTHDARGQITLVAAEPSVWQPSELPGPLNLFFVVILEDDEPEAPTLVPGQTASYSMRVIGPNDTVLAFWEQNVVTPASADPGLPSRVSAVMPVTIVAQHEGLHTVALVTRYLGGEYQWLRTFRVRLSPS